MNTGHSLPPRKTSSAQTAMASQEEADAAGAAADKVDKTEDAVVGGIKTDAAAMVDAEEVAVAEVDKASTPTDPVAADHRQNVNAETSPLLWLPSRSYSSTSWTGTAPT